MNARRRDDPRARRLLVQVVLLPIVALATLALSMVWQVGEVFRSVDMMTRTHGVISQAHELQQLFVDMETGERGYALGHDPSFLEPFVRAAPRIGTAFGTLRELSNGEPEDLATLDELERTYAAWEAHARTVIARVRDGMPFERVDEAPGKALMDRMRGLVALILEREAARRDVGISSLRHRERAIAAGGATVAIALGLLLAFVGRRQIVTLTRSHAQNLASLESRTTELRRSEELFRLTVEGVRDYAICVLDPAGRIVRWNTGAERLYGYDEAEVAGTPIARFHPEETRAGVDGKLETALRTDVFTEEIQQVGRDGRRFLADVTVRPLRDARGLIGFVQVVRDVTEQRRLEGEREAAMSELREALDARDEFLSIASHELRTPLTALLLQLQGLERTARARAIPDDVLRRISLGVRQAARLARLIDDLLDVSRIRTGRLKLEVEEVDLAALVRDQLERSHESARTAGCEVSYEGPQRLVGTFDRLRIEQVLTNLLSNAFKYGPGRPVDVRLEEAGGLARLTIQDRGIGIEPEAMPRIFKRFERGVSSRSYGGLGLGLYITRQIVTAHEGSVRVESRPGEGATFVVELPLKPPAP